MIFRTMHVATLIKSKRLEKKFSQQDLSAKLGFTNKQGQFISNIERGLCNLPVQRAKILCELLDIDQETIKSAMILDFTRNVNQEFEKHFQ
jgi:transcriptional regulator with XRE-family HTH domain